MQLSKHPYSTKCLNHSSTYILNCRIIVFMPFRTQKIFPITLIFRSISTVNKTGQRILCLVSLSLLQSRNFYNFFFFSFLTLSALQYKFCLPILFLISSGKTTLLTSPSFSSLILLLSRFHFCAKLRSTQTFSINFS